MALRTAWLWSTPAPSLLRAPSMALAMSVRSWLAWSALRPNDFATMSNDDAKSSRRLRRWCSLRCAVSVQPQRDCTVWVCGVTVVPPMLPMVVITALPSRSTPAPGPHGSGRDRCGLAIGTVMPRG